MLAVPWVNHVLSLCPLQAVAVTKQDKQLPAACHSLPGMLRGAVVSPQSPGLAAVAFCISFPAAIPKPNPVSSFLPSQLAPLIQF